MVRAAVLAVLLVCSACGAATLVASETLTAACTQTADEIADAYERGDLTRQEALDRLGGARAVCDRLHDTLEGDDADAGDAGVDAGDAQ